MYNNPAVGELERLDNHDSTQDFTLKYCNIALHFIFADIEGERK